MELGAGVVKRVVVEGEVDFAEEVVTAQPVAVPDRHTQRAGLQLALGHVVLETHGDRQTIAHSVRDSSSLLVTLN